MAFGKAGFDPNGKLNLALEPSYDIVHLLTGCCTVPFVVGTLDVSTGKTTLLNQKNKNKTMIGQKVFEFLQFNNQTFIYPASISNCFCHVD